MLLVLDVLRLKCLFDIIIIEHLITLMKHCLRYLHNCLMLRDLLWIKHHALTCDAGLRWVSVKVDWLLHLRWSRLRLIVLNIPSWILTLLIILLDIIELLIEIRGCGLLLSWYNLPWRRLLLRIKLSHVDKRSLRLLHFLITRRPCLRFCLFFHAFNSYSFTLCVINNILRIQKAKLISRFLK